MVEPQRNIVTALRDNLTDYNSSNRVGTQWIHGDLPRVKDLGVNSYPRIGITVIRENGEPVGTDSSDMVNEITFRVQIWSVKHLSTSNSQEGQQLTDTIARDIKSWLRQNWRTDTNLKGKLFGYRYDSDRQIGYAEDTSIAQFGRELEITFTGFNLGE